jgi:hypothetical protein
MTAPGSAGPPTPYPVPPGHDQPATPYSAYPGPDGPAPHGPLAPPPGPGVSPPFAAPPTEGRTLRMWIGLGVAGLAVVLFCGGGAAALVGLVVAGGQAANEQARAVVGDYFAAVKDKQYGKAYDLLCDSDQSRESPAQFERRVAAQPEISAYRVGEPSVAGRVTVPVDVTYSGGKQDFQLISLAQDSGTGRLEVCGVR